MKKLDQKPNQQEPVNEPEPHGPSPTLKWTFAKTLAKTPHEYCMRTPENAAAFDELGEFWKKYGEYRVWSVNGRRYRYWFAQDGFRYWLIRAGANRTRIEDAEAYFAEQIKQAEEDLKAKRAAKEAKLRVPQSAEPPNKRRRR
jgi:hypothetical protein